MIKTTAKKSKINPVPEICFLQRILPPLTDLPPFASLDFDRRFFSIFFLPFIAFSFFNVDTSFCKSFQL